ncbi:MAG: FAD-dependent oxidoreductase [Propionibacteriaceae bacterium]|jgi:thioredoxin reductase (NADPH)|nr:FAD-dependent oxidoreductase [Propionibacteriaceae bacterium]
MDDLYDAVVVGGGPAGLTAALYLARASYRVVVVEKDRIGGQITITDEVVNYPGIPRASGEQITAIMKAQAESFGAEFLAGEVTGFDLTEAVQTVSTSAGTLRTLGLVLAPGGEPKAAGFSGEADFKGHGVAYCATCDGEFFSGLDVLVVGGGHSAADEALFLTAYANHVTVLVRRDTFRCPRTMVERLEANEKVTILYNTTLEEVSGDTVLRTARLLNTLDGTVTDSRPSVGETFGVFVFIGYAPATGLLRGIVDLDDEGHILTDDSLQTSLPGVFAAGDVRQKPLRQLVTAAADGAIAATGLERHIAQVRAETGLVTKPVSPTRTTSESAPGTESSARSGLGDETDFFTAEIRAQLDTVFTKLTSDLEIRLQLDDREVSQEVRGFAETLVSLTDRLSLTISDEPCPLAPRLSLWRSGQPTGIAFHGVPGGHEFNSFVIGLYNAAGPGQALDEPTRARIAAISQPYALKIFVSLSCTMCPATVMAAQQIAALSPHVTAEAFDLAHFGDLRTKFSVMSVPALLINDDPKVHFGKMGVPQVLDLLGV